MLRFVPITLLLLFTALVFSVPSQHDLTVSFLDVGQGDSIFIEGPTGVQLLIDGGPDSSVLRELGKRMPFWDRTIDAVVATHPDKDHIAGLTDVFRRYEINAFLEPGIENDTSPSVALQEAVRDEGGVSDTSARRGMRLMLGGGAYADIVFPDRDVSGIETNTGSIIMRVVYGDTSFLLTGDSPQSVEKYVVTLDGVSLKSTVLKAGHHGSKTSSAAAFVAAAAPQYAVFSRGCDNSYGHPAPEVVTFFKDMRIPTFDTCTDGTVIFESDGRTVSVKTD